MHHAESLLYDLNANVFSYFLLALQFSRHGMPLNEKENLNHNIFSFNLTHGIVASKVGLQVHTSNTF